MPLPTTRSGIAHSLWQRRKKSSVDACHACDPATALATVGAAEGLGWRQAVGVGAAVLTSVAAAEAYAARRREEDQQELVVGDQVGNDAAFGGDDSWLDDAEVLWGGADFAASSVAAARDSFESATDKIAKEIGELLLPRRARFG